MNTEPNHRTYGLTVSAWIAKTPTELHDDAVGLWQIVDNRRRGFGLEGAALVDFVVRAVIELVKAGAQPVESHEGDRVERAKPGYGEQPEEIASNAVAQWKESGQDPDVSGLWFALP